MERNNSIMIALLAGAAAGLAIGFLLAPDKGSDTRTKFKEAAKKFADDLLEKAEEAIDKMSEQKTKI
ncbi:MAG: YtxH domain-containing protein [Bacteroidota bacterium]|nr:YtxH domain-containing protein [Bacteroidota bacterium]